MKKVLFFAPKFGNGGIVSWATKLVETFPNDEFDVISVSSNYNSKKMSANMIIRIFFNHISNKIASDKSCSTCNQNICHYNHSYLI